MAKQPEQSKANPAQQGTLYMEKNIYVLWAAMLIYVFILLEQFNFLVKKEVSRILLKDTMG